MSTFRRDIANVLRATACASEGSMGMAVQVLGDPELCHELDAAGIPYEKLLQVYRLAMRNTLLSVGLAFGLERAETLGEAEYDIRKRDVYHPLIESWVERDG